MIGDPFQLAPSSFEPNPLNLNPPDGRFTSFPSLIPQTRPNNYVQENGKTVTTPNISLNDLLGLAANKTIAPSYEYTFEQEKRFHNPYLQFNPKPLGGEDIEDIYGKFQGTGEQLWNALVKTGATAAASFISNFSTSGSSIDAVRGGQPFDEDSVLGQTQSWLKELEYDYPNYYTAWEREHPFKSAITPIGMANFWGDKVLKNVGFTVGSLASSFLVDAGINLATGGTGTPATFVLAANQIKKAIAPLKNIFRTLGKTAVLGKVDELAGLGRVGVGINEGLKTLNTVYNLRKGLQFAGTTYFAAQGEAMIEGYQTYWDTKANLYKQELSKGTLTPNRIQEIENTAQEAANMTTVLNLPIIAASNLLQFPILFGGKAVLKQFDSPFLNIVSKEGLTVVNNYSKKQAWVNTMKELVKDFATEGGEEGYQYYIGKSIHDYYVDKFNGTANQTLSKYLGEQFPKTVKEEPFWESVVIGGLAGGLMGSVQGVKRNLIGANQRTNQAVQALQPVLDRFNSTVKDYVHFAENLEHGIDENATNQFQSAHKALYSTVHDTLKYGTFDNFQDSIEDLKNLSVEEYNKLFGTDFNEREKLNQLSKIQKESVNIKDDLTQVNKFFQRNPFDSSYVSQRLKDIYKLDQTQINNYKIKLFEDFKELTAYNISRLRNTRGRIRDIENELKIIGLSDSIIPVLYNMDSIKGMQEYKKFKQVQLQSLEEEVDYYKILEQPQEELNLKVNNLKRLIKRLDEIKEGSEEFKELIFNEEVGARQFMTERDFRDRQEELNRQQDIAVNTAEEIEVQTTNPEEAIRQQVETIANMVEPEQVEVTPVENTIQRVADKLFNFEELTDEDFAVYQQNLDRIKAILNIRREKQTEIEPIPISPEISKQFETLPPEEIKTVKPEQKKLISEQQRIKKEVQERKKEPVTPVKNGIYLIKGDNKRAWRYIDEEIAVPLTLKVEKDRLVYEGDMTQGVKKRIVEGYLLDDQYITEEKKEPVLSQDYIPIDEERLVEIKEETLQELNKLKEFLTEPVSSSLEKVLEWRIGKGIIIEC